MKLKKDFNKEIASKIVKAAEQCFFQHQPDMSFQDYIKYVNEEIWPFPHGMEFDTIVENFFVSCLWLFHKSTVCNRESSIVTNGYLLVCNQGEIMIYDFNTDNYALNYNAIVDIKQQILQELKGEKSNGKKT